jgi:hypothetical protein
MAFQSDEDNPLIFFLLSLSALHLQTLSPGDRVVGFASAYYFDLGLQKFNAMLSQLDEENSPFVFISSVLISIHVLLSRQHRGSQHLYSVPGSWFQTMQGIGKVASAVRPWIQKSKLEPLLLKINFPSISCLKRITLPCDSRRF